MTMHKYEVRIIKTYYCQSESKDEVKDMIDDGVFDDCDSYIDIEIIEVKHNVEVSKK